MARRRVISRILREMPGRIEAEVGSALFAAGNMIQVEAQISLTTGAVSGKNHKPSAPGTPPNQDTGVLGDSIETNMVGPMHVRITADAVYAAAQEFGNSRLPARPYMAPAANKMRPEANALVRKAVKRAVDRVVAEARRGSGR